MNNVIDKGKLIKSINEKINYLNSESTTEGNNLKVNELNDLLYVINKGCFDKVYNTSAELDEYIKENSGIWDLTDVKEFLLYHKNDIIQILQRL